MPYNSLTERQKLLFRLTARQAVPRNLHLHRQKNLAVVRHANRPSNDEGLDFDNRAVATVMAAAEFLREHEEEIKDAIEDAIPDPVITSPTNGETMDDALYPISGTALRNSQVSLFYNDDTEAVATTTADAEGNFVFDGDQEASNGVYWHVEAGGKTSERVQVFIAEPEPEPEPEPETEPDPPVTFKTHAESDTYLTDNAIDPPEGWSSMTLAQKADWVNGV